MNNEDIMKYIEQLDKEGRLEEEIDKFLRDDRLPDFIAEKFFTAKQWDALIGEIPMTQEMFDRCLWVCDHVNDSVWFHRIVEQFPELNVNFSKDVCEKHKAAHDAYGIEYLAKFREDGLLFQE